jgi:putative endonuclease
MEGDREPQSPSRLELGRAGEDAAVECYRRAGYRVIVRNWRCALGEVDLVLARGRTIVFCEVKTRRDSAFGPPFEAVTSKKQRKLRLLAQAFLLADRTQRPIDLQVRFDVASVTVNRDGRSSLHLFEDAF